MGKGIYKHNTHTDTFKTHLSRDVKKKWGRRHQPVGKIFLPFFSLYTSFFSFSRKENEIK